MIAARRIAAAALAVVLMASTASASEALDALPLRGGGGAEPAATSGAASAPKATGPSVVRVLGSLGAVAVLIVGLGYAYKRFSGTAGGKGAGAVGVVSRTAISPRQQVMVLKVGHRLLVVGDAGHGLNPLAEITDPAEITAVLTAAGGGAELEALRRDAFAASLESAEDDYNHEPRESFDDEPQSNIEPADVTNADVRALIERVRGMSRAPTS